MTRAFIRPAATSDLEALYEMAKLTGGGFTNLPAHRDALAEKLHASAAAFAREEDGQGDDLYILMLEDPATGRLAGTAQVIARTGHNGPFYSYRRTTLTQHSKAMARTFRAEMLALVNDLEGCSEVGGLFLHPRYRAGGLGLLLARSRYLLIRQHRARFADKLIAELRGVIDEGGGSPFWDGVAGRFFGITFQEADEFNARNGHQHLQDLMPRHPVYLAMLPDSARAVIGVPHATGRAAMRMLEHEGFANDGYLDIFDGGPTMSVPVDRLRTVRDAREAVVGSGTPVAPLKAIVATGHLQAFRACFADVALKDGRLMVDAGAQAALGVGDGDTVLHIAR